MGQYAKPLARNRNTDIFRSIALLWMMLYHVWVTTGQYQFHSGMLTQLIQFGGEIGVTAFFVLSGFGMYFSIDRMYQGEGFSWRMYAVKRIKRVVPQYYFCIAVCFLLSQGYLLSKDGLLNVLAHLFFVHDWFMQYHGSINGVMWTMAVIVQFYVLAPFLYRFCKRAPYIFLLLSVGFAVTCKYVTFHYAMPRMAEPNPMKYFIYGREVTTALDNFALGMFSAWFLQGNRRWPKFIGRAGAVLCIASLVVWVRVGAIFGLHSDQWCGYIWHTVLSLDLAVLLVFLSGMRTFEERPVYRSLLELARVEYAVYLWHLLIFYNLIQNSAWIQTQIVNMRAPLLYIPLILVACLFGKIMTDHF